MVDYAAHLEGAVDLIGAIDKSHGVDINDVSTHAGSRVSTLIQQSKFQFLDRRQGPVGSGAHRRWFDGKRDIAVDMDLANERIETDRGQIDHVALDGVGAGLGEMVDYAAHLEGAVDLIGAIHEGHSVNINDVSTHAGSRVSTLIEHAEFVYLFLSCGRCGGCWRNCRGCRGCCRCNSCWRGSSGWRNCRRCSGCCRCGGCCRCSCRQVFTSDQC